MGYTRLLASSFGSVALVLGITTRAQNPPPIGNPAGMSPDTPGVYEAHPQKDYPNTADALFAREASLGGAAEVDAAKLAARKAQSPGVKSFANLMVSDHSKANDKLRAAIGDNHIKTSAAPDMDHKVMLDQLNKASGKGFDELYIRGQVMEHQKTAQLYEWIIDSGQDPRLTAYAMQALPVVLHHLEMAKSLQAQLTGSAP
jgi:putative membrane protein